VTVTGNRGQRWEPTERAKSDTEPNCKWIRWDCVRVCNRELPPDNMHNGHDVVGVFILTVWVGRPKNEGLKTMGEARDQTNNKKRIGLAYRDIEG